MKKTVFFCLGLVLLLFGCQQDADIPSLSEHYKGVFDIGAAIEPEEFEKGGKALDVLNKHFSVVTTENAMKWISIHPTADTWNFGPADSIVAYAQKQGKKVRGHCLIWHHPEQTADWMFMDENGDLASREVMLKRMETHIKTVVGRYKGKVYAWDVVNEPIDTSNEDGLRQSRWYTTIGPDYIEQALRFAHEADPDALLFINEDNVHEYKRMSAMIKLITDLKAKGAPLNGLGMEFHIGINRPKMEAIEKAIQEYSKLGIELHVTELDMSLYAQKIEELTEPPPVYLIHQGHRYKELMDIFLKNKATIKNITFWGYTDKNTWLRETYQMRLDWPLLFDDNLQPKHAFWALVNPEKLPSDEGWASAVKPAAVYKASKGTPVIDGEVDEIWKKAPEVTTDIFAMGKAGAKAKVRVLWDADHVYVLADVADPVLSDKSSQVHEKDSFELFLDENNGKTPSFESDDYQFRVNIKNGKSWTGAAKEKYFRTAVKTFENKGYLVEIVVDLQGARGAVGTQMGLEFQVNDDNGAGSRTAITKWNDPSNESWRDTSSWGILELVE